MQKGDVVCSKYPQNKTTHRAQLNSKVNKFSLKIDLILMQIINVLVSVLQTTSKGLLAEKNSEDSKRKLHFSFIKGT